MGLKTRMALSILAVVGLALAGGEVRAMSLEHLNLVDLLRRSTSIVTGKVMGITEGVDENGLPYTEVTVAISDTIRGTESGNYTFRQFGLQTPRLSADGTKTLMPAPEAFPRYAEGEEVMLFLYKPAAITGLRAPTGLVQGKFTLAAGRAENGIANEGLFQQISLADGLATDNDRRMLDTSIGAVSSPTFTSFVERAVTEQWVESCAMYRTDVGPTCGGGKVTDPNNPTTPRTKQIR